MLLHSLVVCGHLTKQEIASLKAEGWRKEQPNVNKNGIPLQKPKIGGNIHETNH